MKISMLALLLLAATAAPATVQAAAPQQKSLRKAPGQQESLSKAPAKPAKQASDDFNMAQVMKMVDKVFPAQPDPPPQRLALARFTAAGMLPNGTYAGMFEDMMAGTVERVLALSPADFGAQEDKKGSASRESLRQVIAKDDPHFEQRMRITRRVIGEELIKISALVEPRLREGLARAIAHRFDEAQLREINTFLATPSGKAFAGQSMRMWVDPDVMRAMVQAMPHMIAAMPGAMLRLEAETAHLPKPKKKSETPSKSDDEEDDPMDDEN